MPTVYERGQFFKKTGCRSWACGVCGYCRRGLLEENGGVSFEAAMGRIHAILADGTIIKNVEVFRRVYETLG